MYGIIYCVTNTVNGKKYVGQTRLGLVTRWRYHMRFATDGSMGASHCAIRKYGNEVFRVEQIDVAETLEELNEKETHCIVQLNTLTPSGYNLTTGGDAHAVSNETRVRMSVSRRNRVISKETGQRISKALRRTSCRRGHPFDSVNLYVSPNTGERGCLTCWYLNHKQALPEKLRCYVSRNS